jgi:hypothetical protein
MISKKLDGKHTARSRRSLASPLLVRTVCGTTRAPLLEEPWRNKKSKGKNRGGK